jgi:hypothetical protein
MRMVKCKKQKARSKKQEEGRDVKIQKVVAEGQERVEEAGDVYSVQPHERWLEWIYRWVY